MPRRMQRHEAHPKTTLYGVVFQKIECTLLRPRLLHRLLGPTTFNDQSSKSTFLKLPGRWYELIENVCTDLGRERPGTESFRINLDHKISEAEARASQSEELQRQWSNISGKRAFYTED